MTPMSAHPEDDLQRLLAEEPFVRGLARQLVVEDPDEVVQQTFLQAIRQGGRDIERPRNWLARIVRNVANNLRRDRHRRAAHQRAAAVDAMVPSAADLAEREERRRALVQAINRLSPSLRAVVLMRWFEGLPPRQIANLLQIPVATVSKQLQRAHDRLRHLLDSQYGGQRRAWLLPLVPFALRPPVPVPLLLPVLPALTSGAIAMTIKSKLALAATVILAVGVWIWWPNIVEPPTAPPKTNVEASIAPAHADLDRQAKAASANANSIEREAVTTPAIASTEPTTGSVVVHLRYGDDKTPAAGMMMGLRKLGADSRYSCLRSRTDETGTARYDDVQPGQMYVSPINGAGKRVEVIANKTAEVEIELEIGMNLTGIVIDPDRRPVAGALIETTPMAHADAFPEVMTVSGADGRFAIRATHTLCLIGARADGYVASNVRFLHGKKGNSAEVELMLGAKGGMVDGTVVDEHDEPVANATVIIGKGKLSGTAAAITSHRSRP